MKPAFKKKKKLSHTPASDGEILSTTNESLFILATGRVFFFVLLYVDLVLAEKINVKIKINI
jgi:hypothetical protein